MGMCVICGRDGITKIAGFWLCERDHCHTAAMANYYEESFGVPADVASRASVLHDKLHEEEIKCSIL